jgi:tripartite-type tricarboxylate transporter receptor subunit TctC
MHPVFMRALIGLISSMALLFSLPASSQSYPLKPITVVVTQGAGSGSDVMARLLAGFLSPLLGQSVVVENRAGASGIIGHQSVAKAPADGYTLLFTSTAGLFVVPVMNPNAKYSLSDYEPVAPVMRAPFAVLVANTGAAPKTMADLISATKSKPQSYASAGVGTMTHLGSELMMRKAGIQATHIPYKGSGAALTDLMGGQVLFATDSLTAAMPHIRSGKLRALATTDTTREATLPDVPTLAEAGLPGVQVSVIGGLFAPKGIPKDVVDKIADATRKVLTNPEVVKRFAAVETDPLNIPIASFNDLLRKEAEIWSPMVRQLDLKQE